MIKKLFLMFLPVLAISALVLPGAVKADLLPENCYNTSTGQVALDCNNKPVSRLECVRSPIYSCTDYNFLKTWWFITGLATTIGLELAILARVFKRSKKQDFAIIAGVNLVTYSTLHFTLNKISQGISYNSSINSITLLLEIAVFIIEALVYFKFLKVKFVKALLMSLVANISSVLAGLALIVILT